MDHDLVDYLELVREHNGSDLHICAGAPPQVRIDGNLHSFGEEPLKPKEAKELIFAVLKESERAKLESDWEIDFALQIANIGRFRGNAHYSQSNVEAAFRYIPDTVPELQSLGHYEIVDEFCKAREGLVLVTGITGSGKSTTLAAMAKRIADSRASVIVTIEDPIEFVFERSSSLIKQRQVGSDTHSFSNALRAAMRQDPDVIMVSEMRDLETIRTAVTAAETGHLVISTLHTLDAPNTCDRLIDVFPPEQQQQIAAQLANSLVGIVSQNLLPAKSGSGRVLVSEVMKANHATRTCIRERKLEQMLGLIEIGNSDGMHTRDQCLVDLAARDEISTADALDFSRDRKFVTEQIQIHREAQQAEEPFWEENKEQ